MNLKRSVAVTVRAIDIVRWIEKEKNIKLRGAKIIDAHFNSKDVQFIIDYDEEIMDGD